ncbi:MAG: hypothetical protein AAF645_12585 [Myxococcota bacterium]
MKGLLQQLCAKTPGPEVLAGCVHLLRPRGDNVAEALECICDVLEQEPELAANCRELLASSLGSLRFTEFWAESGVLLDRELFALVVGGLTNAWIPPVRPEHDARHALAEATRRGDWRWIDAIPSKTWARLLVLLVPEGDVRWDLDDALRTLSLRAAAGGVREEVMAKLAPEDSSGFRTIPAALESALLDDGAIEALRAHLRECQRVLTRLREDKRVYGTSLVLTRRTRRMTQQLARMEALLRLRNPKDARERATVLAALVKRLVKAEQEGPRLRTRLRHVVDELAYQITEHTAAKGESYASAEAGTWSRMLKKALAGGAIVGVFAIVKLLAKKLELSLAGEALIYGLNYAVCFVLIYALGGTLATKQPAVTASAIAKELDAIAERGDDFHGVADKIVYVWRSQFVAFLGNLAFAFPVAFAFGFGIERLFGTTTVDTEKAAQLLAANHPFEGPALFYAAVAGVFLFTAGLIQGAVENRVVYTRLEERLRRHRGLRWLGERQNALAAGVAKHAGAVTSNIVLGFFLGSAGVVGTILGLPIDIRHIAFSSAHVGVAVLDAPELVNAAQTAVLVIGVLGIGFINFVVSFGLTLMVTLKSRQVTIPQGGSLFLHLLKRFFRSPLEWFFPVSGGRGLAESQPTTRT